VKRALPTLLRTALAALALPACAAALAADAAPTRRCVLLAAEYETQGGSSAELMDALRFNTRLTRNKLLQRLQADRLVANAVLLDVDGRITSAARLHRIREITGCDTVVQIRNVLWSSSIGGAFGFDVVVDRTSGDASTTLYSRQYRYGLNHPTISAFSYDAFVDMAWADLHQAAVLDADRAAPGADDAAVRAEYDRMAAAWPKNLPEYHLRHILRESELLGIAMIARLHDQNPPEFGGLAADSSDDKASAAKGGDLGWYTLGLLPPEIAAAVRAQGGRTGLVDRPIHTDDGWHVVEVLGERPSHAPAFADVSDRLGANLRWNATVPPVTWAEALRAQ
jgi:hypothetical protein